MNKVLNTDKLDLRSILREKVAQSPFYNPLLRRLMTNARESPSTFTKTIDDNFWDLNDK